MKNKEAREKTNGGCQGTVGTSDWSGARRSQVLHSKKEIAIGLAFYNCSEFINKTKDVTKPSNLDFNKYKLMPIKMAYYPNTQ